MYTVRQSSQEKAREEHEGRVEGKCRGPGVASLREVEDEKAGDDGIVEIDESHGDTGCEQITAEPPALFVVRRGVIILAHEKEESRGRNRPENLKFGGVRERPQHLAGERSRRDTTPDAAAHVPQSSRTAMNSGDLDGPRRRACIETRLADPLEGASDIHRRNAPRQKISHARQRTTAQPGEECALSPPAIRDSSGERTAAQRDDGKRSDDKSDNTVRGSQIAADMRREPGQNGSESEKSEESRCNETPEASPQRRKRQIGRAHV